MNATNGSNGGGKRVPQFRANGVPWLIWYGAFRWKCEVCRRGGRLDEEAHDGQFARLLGDLKREHFECVPPGRRREMLEAQGVGNTLNEFRAEP